MKQSIRATKLSNKFLKQGHDFALIDSIYHNYGRDYVGYNTCIECKITRQCDDAFDITCVTCPLLKSAIEKKQNSIKAQTKPLTNNTMPDCETCLNCQYERACNLTL